MTSPQQHWLAKKIVDIFAPPTPDSARSALRMVIDCASKALTAEDFERICATLDRYDPRAEVAASVRSIHALRLPDARSFLAALLEHVGLGSLERSEIMAGLRLYTPQNRVVVHCPFNLCGKHSEPGLLFCAEHLHEAALLDAERSRTHGPIRACAFKGQNRDGSIGCSIIFRSLTSELCAAHQPAPPPPRGPGATIHTLPLTNAPRRSKKKAKRS